jgi:hypothetical protein
VNEKHCALLTSTSDKGDIEAMDIITKPHTIDKSKDNELHYYASYLCQLLDDIEKVWVSSVDAKKNSACRNKINSIFDLKNKWMDLYLK